MESGIENTSDRDAKVIAAMSKFGGDFVKRLAEAAKRADSDNLERIKKGWPHYWSKYREMAGLADSLTDHDNPELIRIVKIQRNRIQIALGYIHAGQPDRAAVVLGFEPKEG